MQTNKRMRHVLVGGLSYHRLTRLVYEYGMSEMSIFSRLAITQVRDMRLSDKTQCLGNAMLHALA